MGKVRGQWRHLDHGIPGKVLAQGSLSGRFPGTKGAIHASPFPSPDRLWSDLHHCAGTGATGRVASERDARKRRTRRDAIRLAPNEVAVLGVPYAAPPIEDLRWKPPQPARHWTGTHKAAIRSTVSAASRKVVTLARLDYACRLEIPAVDVARGTHRMALLGALGDALLCPPRETSEAGCGQF